MDVAKFEKTQKIARKVLDVAGLTSVSAQEMLRMQEMVCAHVASTGDDDGTQERKYGRIMFGDMRYKLFGFNNAIPENRRDFWAHFTSGFAAVAMDWDVFRCKWTISTSIPANPVDFSSEAIPCLIVFHYDFEAESFEVDWQTVMYCADEEIDRALLWYGLAG